MNKEEILKLIDEEDVEFIRLQFSDAFGNLKNIAVTPERFEKVLDNLYPFDGEGFFDGLYQFEEDLYLCPNLDTFVILPWRPQQSRVGKFICDICYSDGRPFELSPRYILEKVVKKAKEKGYTFVVNPECEFFLFHTDENGAPTTITHEKAGYLDVGPYDLGENARRDMVLMLQEMGFSIEASHHEKAPAQHEISFSEGEAFKTADDIMTFKFAIRSIAKRFGLYATFMPKPLQDAAGSGMHLDISAYKDGVNIFDGAKGMSEDAKYFIGGIMKYAPMMCAITNPIVNSYKRLVPGYEAPVYIAWSGINRSPLIRIPASRGNGTRVELRCADPAANPYLALAVCLRAGLDGIVNHIEPPKSVDRNIYEMTEAERKMLGIGSLPDTLTEAVAEMEADPFIADVLGEHVFQKYTEAKREEWNRYRSQVTEWEINEYLNKI